jgi:hypothetical protein
MSGWLLKPGHWREGAAWRACSLDLYGVSRRGEIPRGVMGVDRSRVRGRRWCGGEERRRRSAVAGDVAPGKEEICERRRTRVCGGDEGGVCERSRWGWIRADLEKLSDQILVSRGPKLKACGANTNFTTRADSLQNFGAVKSEFPSVGSGYCRWLRSILMGDPWVASFMHFDWLEKCVHGIAGYLYFYCHHIKKSFFCSIMPHASVLGTSQWATCHRSLLFVAHMPRR